ncbi:MAG: antibiotic biosynthesis monooxygenase [Chlamydiota bacterium]
MTLSVDDEVIFTISVSPQKGCEDTFLDWKKRLNTLITSFSGFISIEFSISPKKSEEWVITQRFQDKNSLQIWQGSNEHKLLMNDLHQIAERDEIKRILSKTDEAESGVTEVIVTRINPGKEVEFREWMASIHQVEAKFPGFRGAYVQSLRDGQCNNWITLLQFDTNENLERWLSSEERKNVLKKSEFLVDSLDQHRIISPYAGWFSRLSDSGKAPPDSKQAMVVLLVLFPIVTLEIQFLTPYISGLGLSLSTFIGNTISVAILTWLMMPTAIKGLGRWLSPNGQFIPLKNWLGTFLVFAIYAFEVVLFRVFQS